MQTKRELYSFVADLGARRRVGQPSLEVYLRAMWGLASVQPSRAVWTLDEFAELLAASFVAPEVAFDERWRALEPEPRGSGFDRWQHAILGQIVDLHEMGEAGVLNNELRYYGLDAPRGARWYNFDPCSYLESATQGGLLSAGDGECSGIDWASFTGFLGAGRDYE
jgi:hypothetical protein